MGKKLKIWNGPDWCARGSIYVAAYSKKHAMELVLKAAGYPGACTIREINGYWGPCWGDSMKGITPEVGVWHQKDFGSPVVRLV